MGKVWEALTDAAVAFIRASERALWTFVQSFIGALAATTFTDLDALGAAAVGGISAGLAVLSVAARTRLGQLGD